MDKYTLYKGACEVLTAMGEHSIRDYLVTHKGKLDEMTIYSAEDTELTEPMSGKEWLMEQLVQTAIEFMPDPPKQYFNHVEHAAWTHGYISAYIKIKYDLDYTQE